MLGNNTNNTQKIIDTITEEVIDATENIITSLPNTNNLANKQDIQILLSMMSNYLGIGYPSLCGRQFSELQISVPSGGVKSLFPIPVRFDFYNSFLLIDIERDVGINILEDKVTDITLTRYQDWNLPDSSIYKERLDAWFSSIRESQLNFNITLIEKNTRKFKTINLIEKSSDHQKLSFAYLGAEVLYEFDIPKQVIRIKTGGFYDGPKF